MKKIDLWFGDIKMVSDFINRDEIRPESFRLENPISIDGKDFCFEKKDNDVLVTHSFVDDELFRSPCWRIQQFWLSSVKDERAEFLRTLVH